MSNGKSLPDLGAIYHTVVADIAFFKRQQWVATNYVVLVYVVVFFMEERDPFKGKWQWDVSLWLVSLAALLAGIFVLGSGHGSINKGRKRLDALKDELPERIGKILTQTQDVRDKEKTNWMTGLFLAVQVVGFGLITAILVGGLSMISAILVNSVGLGVAILGAVVLAFVPPAREETQEVIRRNRKIWWIGLGLLIFGFVVQLIGNYIA